LDFPWRPRHWTEPIRDLQQSLGGSLPSPVRIERFATVGDEFAELLCSLHDVGHAQFIAATQMGTDSLRM